jgi:hypothetical protein
MDWLVITISSGARGNQDKVRHDKLVRSNRWKSGTGRHRFFARDDARRDGTQHCSCRSGAPRGE